VEVPREPAGGKIRHLLERARLLEEMRGARHDFELDMRVPFRAYGSVQDAGSFSVAIASCMPETIRAAESASVPSQSNTSSS